MNNKRSEYAISDTKGSYKIIINFEKNKLVSKKHMYITLRNYRGADAHLTNGEMFSILKFAMFEYLDMTILNLGTVLNLNRFRTQSNVKIQIKNNSVLPLKVDVFDFCDYLKKTLFGEDEEGKALYCINECITKVVENTNTSLTIYNKFLKKYSIELSSEFIIRNLTPTIYDILLIVSIIR